MTHLDLFSGIGGFSLAAHWAGFKTVGFVEKEPFCQKILAKNFPGIPIHDDITTFTGIGFRGVDLVSGGFPCPDISQAGLGAGIHGDRSSLFFEMARVIFESSPRWVLVENVAMLRHRGLEQVLKTFASIGYWACWFTYSARAVGAPHERKRMFLVAHPNALNGETWLRNVLDWSKQGANLNGEIYARDVWRVPFSGLLRMDDGVPKGVDRSRIEALGNAVVPQQVYPILKAIADYERSA